MCWFFLPRKPDAVKILVVFFRIFCWKPRCFWSFVESDDLHPFTDGRPKLWGFRSAFWVWWRNRPGAGWKHKSWKLDDQRMGWMNDQTIFFHESVVFVKFWEDPEFVKIMKVEQALFAHIWNHFYELGPGFKKPWKYYEIPAVVSKFKVFCYFGSFFVGRLTGVFVCQSWFSMSSRRVSRSTDQGTCGRASVSSSPIPGTKKWQVELIDDEWLATCQISGREKRWRFWTSLGCARFLSVWKDFDDMHHFFLFVVEMRLNNHDLGIDPGEFVRTIGQYLRSASCLAAIRSNQPGPLEDRCC